MKHVKQRVVQSVTCLTMNSLMQGRSNKDWVERNSRNRPIRPSAKRYESVRHQNVQGAHRLSFAEQKQGRGN